VASRLRLPRELTSKALKRGVGAYRDVPENVLLNLAVKELAARIANVAKYLDGQPVLGFNPEPARNPGVLVPHSPDDAGSLFGSVLRGGAIVESRTMVEAIADDGQSLLALNEIYLGHPSHQTARYSLRIGERSERQASSGIIVGTGTGATGWCRSAWLERRSSLELPGVGDPVLAWFVREAWPSPATGTTLTKGLCVGSGSLEVAVESDRLVAFGDSIEDDRLDVSWGADREAAGRRPPPQPVEVAVSVAPAVALSVVRPELDLLRPRNSC
jgi:hypothetical protein